MFSSDRHLLMGIRPLVAEVRNVSYCVSGRVQRELSPFFNHFVKTKRDKYQYLLHSVSNSIRDNLTDWVKVIDPWGEASGLSSIAHGPTLTLTQTSKLSLNANKKTPSCVYAVWAFVCACVSRFSLVTVSLVAPVGELKRFLVRLLLHPSFLLLWMPRPSWFCWYKLFCLLNAYCPNWGCAT